MRLIGSGDDDREEGGGGEVLEIAAGSWVGAAVEVDGVGEGLEAVEGEAEGENPVVELVISEGQKLCCCEQAEVDEQAEGNEQLAAAGEVGAPRKFLKLDADAEVDRRGG